MWWWQLLGRWLTGRARQVVVALLVILILLPQIWAIRTLYPHLLSYYSEAIGGVAGATKMGLEATYWCETYNEVLDYLNENGEAGDIVYIDPYSHDVMYYYQRQGLLRDDLVFTSTYPATSIYDEAIKTSQRPFSRADFVVLHSRSTTFGPEGLDSPLAKWLAKQEPDFEMVQDGVPLIRVYQKE